MIHGFIDLIGLNEAQIIGTFFYQCLSHLEEQIFWTRKFVSSYFVLQDNNLVVLLIGCLWYYYIAS